MKKKLGIIGGMGSQAGVWLMQRVITLCGAKTDQEYPEIILHSNSCIPDRTRAILGKGSSPVEELRRSVRLMNEQDVAVVVMACMTAYYFYDQVARDCAGVMIHPLELVKEELGKHPVYSGCGRVGLIGSSGLIRSRLVHDALGAAGIEVVTLNERDQETYFMKPVYQGAKTDKLDRQVKDAFLYQLDLLRAQGAEVILGACSEVPLFLEGVSPIAGFIDVFELLAQHIVKICYYQPLCNINTDSLSVGSETMLTR